MAPLLERVHDHGGHLSSKIILEKLRYILVIFDYFSRFVIAFTVPDIQAATTIQCLESMLHQYLIPIAVWADLGRSFFNQEDGSHKAAGMVERVNLVLHRCLLRGEPAELNEDKTDFAEAMWSLINICPRVPSSPKQATLTLQPYREALLLPSGAA